MRERERYKTPSLRPYRLLCGKTQREVGDEAGVSGAFISQLETGRADARPSTIEALAMAVYAEISDLLKEPAETAPALTQKPVAAGRPESLPDALPKAGERAVSTVGGRTTRGVVEERSPCAFTGLTYFRILPDDFPYPLVQSSLTVRREAA